MSVRHTRATEVRLPAGDATLVGDLVLPEHAEGIVLFAHGSGSSRHSPRNRFVAETLNAVGMGTLLLDLLTPEEEYADTHTREHRFDIELLARRLTAAVDWIRDTGAPRLPIGVFGASTGAAAALVTAAERPDEIGAVVSRGGRPDLAGDALRRVQAPTLLIVGGADPVVLRLNREASERLVGEKELLVVPGASHLFEEPGALERVARVAAQWFSQHLAGDDGTR
jgi:pimeloyl-ACP methyl ester carboxylesterase